MASSVQAHEFQLLSYHPVFSRGLSSTVRMHLGRLRCKL